MKNYRKLFTPWLEIKPEPPYWILTTKLPVKVIWEICNQLIIVALVIASFQATFAWDTFTQSWYYFMIPVKYTSFLVFRSNYHHKQSSFKMFYLVIDCYKPRALALKTLIRHQKITRTPPSPDQCCPCPSFLVSVNPSCLALYHIPSILSSLQSNSRLKCCNNSTVQLKFREKRE